MNNPDINLTIGYTCQAIEQHPQSDLQVLKYNASTWDTIGGDGKGIVATGSILDAKLKNINGALYLYYRIVSQHAWNGFRIAGINIEGTSVG